MSNHKLSKKSPSCHDSYGCSEDRDVANKLLLTYLLHGAESFLRS